MPLGLLFPGQGSQHVGMGAELAAAYPEARRTFEEADDVLGTPLFRLMTEGPDEELVQTRNAQPAILTHSIAVVRALGELLDPAQAAAGHSLGEFSAHVAAKTLSFADALRAVRLRGELMFEAGRQRPGTMAAVLGLEEGDVEEVCRRASGDDGVAVVANLNSPGQVVISGDVDAVGRAMAEARAAGAKRVVSLTVSGAFHSPLMEPAREGLREGLKAVSFDRSRFPVISNVTAEPSEGGDAAMELLVRQLTAPVRWSESVAMMLEMGIDRFLELGPGSVLTGLNRRNARGVPTAGVSDPAGVEGVVH